MFPPLPYPSGVYFFFFFFGFFVLFFFVLFCLFVCLFFFFAPIAGLVAFFKMANTH